ncbi:MAG: hypothetical protein WAM30_13920 [Candidatus Dormiibacterota bacterium]
MQQSDDATKDTTDLATQFEAILASVWAAEQEWRLDDRITLAVDWEQRRRRETGA